MDFEVNPVTKNVLEKFVLFDELHGDVGKADASIFGTAKRGIEIEVAYIVDRKLSIIEREDTVDYNFYELNQSSFGANVAGVADAFASNCDAIEVRTLFFGVDLTKNFGVGDLLASVQ